MLKNSLFKKCISFVLTIALFTSVVAPASAAVADIISQSSYNAYYVALGDAVTEGYGLDDPDDVYYVKVAEALGKLDDYFAYSHNKLRVEEIRYLLDDGYNGDGYTEAIGSMLKHKRTEVQGYVSNAEVITINAGVRNFSTYIVEQVIYYLENNGAVKYDYSFDAFYDQDVQDALNDIKNVVTEQFAAIAPDEGVKALEFTNYVIEVATYAVMSYVTSFNGMVDSVYKLNPDVELYVIGIYNPMQDEVLTFSNGETTKDIPLGSFFGALVELANAYAQVLAPRAYDYTYVDPGNPELLIDQMGNKNLTDDERFPNGLMAELLDLAGDAALEEIIDIFTEYEIDPSPLTMEAYAERFLDELAYITDADERIEYIREEIEIQANKKVREAFKDKLKEQLGQFADGDKVITDTQVDDLMTDLGAAAATPCADGTCGACRECIAKDFVETLINNPELQKQAAAKLIYNKLENYGLKECVTLEEVEQMLTDMNNCGEDENAREEVVVKFVHDLAVAKVTQYVNEKIGSGYIYTESMADKMLTDMEMAANNDEATAIAKAALWKDIFRQYMIDKIDAKFSENSLTWVNTTPAQFVDDIYAAGDNYEAIVRATVLASGAAKVSDVSFGIYSTNEIITLFSTMDTMAADTEKRSYLEANLRNKFGGLYIPDLLNKFWDAYTSYVDAANTSIKLVGQYLDLVDQAAEALADYNGIQETVVGNILKMYKENYKNGALDLGGLLEGDDGLKELQDLRASATKAILDGYAQYEDALDTAMTGAEQINNELTPVYDMLKQIAEVEKISLNDLLTLGEKVVGDESYITDMANRLVLDKTLKPEETTAAYMALRYFIGNGMMIMPSANGHQTIADQIIKGINGEPTGSAAGVLANKVLDAALDIYHCGKEFLKQPTSASGQVGTLINPDTYIAFGDHVTLGTALNEGEKTYVDLLADALAMEYKDTADFDNDTLLNLSFGGMRSEELYALVDSSYNGDAYTDIRYGNGYIDGLRDKYQQSIKDADLITINVGINNLVSYPLMQSYLAYNGQETYEMDWAYYFGQHRVDKVAKGKTAINKLLMQAVDVADNHIPDVDGFSAYQKCETLLTTVATACESLAYGLLGYIVNLDASVEAIAGANPDATIVLVGFYNPMEDTYLHVENVTLNGKVVDLSEHTPINTSALTEKVINVANRVLTNYVGFYADDLVASGEGSRIVTVPILDTELCVSDTDTIKDLSTLADWTTVSGLGHEVTIKIPQYFLETRKTLGAALHPNGNGHAYIFNEILDALKYEIHADVVPEDNEKYYGDEDPELVYNWDDASSLFEGGTVVNVSREPGEDVGEYKIIVTVEKNGGYYEIDLEEAVFTIKARPITVEVKESTAIVTGDAIPQFTAVITDVLTGKEIQNNGIVEITGVPADSNTAGEYEISANLVDTNYVLKEEVTPATLTIEDKIVVDVTLDGTFSGVYGNDHSNDLHVVYKVGTQVIENPGFTATFEMPEATDKVGKYEVEPVVSGTVHGYELGTVTKVNYEVTARPVNVVVNKNETIYVGEAIPSFSVVVTDKETGNELSAGIVEITGVPADSNTAGNYTITATLKDTNYVIESCTDATLSIVENNVLNITIGGTLTGVYGEEHTGAVILVNGQPNTLAGLDISISGIPAKDANVGTYTITPDVENVPRGYVIGTVTNADYVVTARPINVEVKEDATIFVGDTVPGFTVVITDVLANKVIANNSIVNITGIPEDSNTAGTYTISAELVNNNYKIESCTKATLTIKDKVIVTIGGTLTGVYGNDHSNDMSVVVTVNGQEVVLPNLNITFTAPAANAAAGEYTITPVVNGTVPENYDVTITPVEYTVTKRPVSLDVTVLDGDTITGTAVTAGSMVPGEEIDVLNLVAANGQVTYSNDNYDVTINVISNTSRDVYIKIQPSDGPWYYGDVINTSYLVLDVVTGEVVDVDLQVVLDKTQIDTSILGDHIVKVLSYVPVVGYNVQDITAADSTIRVEARPISVDVTVVDGVITEVTLAEGTLASWDVVENMSVSDWISLLGLTVNDEKTAVSSSNANYNVTIEADFQSSYVPNYVCWNTTTGKYYEIVHLAVLEANKGETIQMIADSDQTKLTDIYHYAGSVNLINGITLDLQGYELKLDSLFAAEGNYVIAAYEKSAGEGGRLVVPQKNLIIKEAAKDGSYTVMPFWLDEGCYVFGVFTIHDNNNSDRGVVIDQVNDTITFQLKHAATGHLNTTYIADNGASDNGLSIEVYLQWNTLTGVSYQHFVFTDELAMKVVGSDDYEYKLTNFSELSIDVSSLTVTAMIVSDTGATAYSHTWDVNGVVTETSAPAGGNVENEYQFVSAAKGEYVCENTRTGKKYAIVHDAVLEAQPGDVIRMIANSDQTAMKDVCPSAGMVNLTNGVTLDLQNYVLKLDVLVAPTANYVIAAYEKSAGVGGRLVVPKKNLIIKEAAKDGSYTVMPFWLDEGCYVFGVFTIHDNNNNDRGVVIDQVNDTITFQLKHAATGHLNTTYIADNGASDNGLSIEVYLQWNTPTGVSYQHFVFTDELAMKVVGSDDYEYKLTNFSELSIDVSSLVVTARIVSNSGATCIGHEFTIENSK